MAVMQVRPERTGWRDQALSLRHRQWGIDCPMRDLDYICLEFDEGVGCALVEYKHEKAEPISANHPSYLALTDLGDRAGVPVLAVRYAGDLSWYRPVPLNTRAKLWVPSPQILSEHQYVDLLYRLRGRKMPVQLFRQLGLEV